MIIFYYINALTYSTTFRINRKWDIVEMPVNVFVDKSLLEVDG